MGSGSITKIDGHLIESEEISSVEHPLVARGAAREVEVSWSPSEQATSCTNKMMGEPRWIDFKAWVAY